MRQCFLGLARERKGNGLVRPAARCRRKESAGKGLFACGVACFPRWAVDLDFTSAAEWALARRSRIYPRRFQTRKKLTTRLAVVVVRGAMTVITFYIADPVDGSWPDRGRGRRPHVKARARGCSALSSSFNIAQAQLSRSHPRIHCPQSIESPLDHTHLFATLALVDWHHCIPSPSAYLPPSRSSVTVFSFHILT